MLTLLIGHVDGSPTSPPGTLDVDVDFDVEVEVEVVVVVESFFSYNILLLLILNRGPCFSLLRFAYFSIKCITKSDHLTGTNLTSISEIIVLSPLLSS